MSTGSLKIGITSLRHPGGCVPAGRESSGGLGSGGGEALGLF